MTRWLKYYISPLIMPVLLFGAYMVTARTLHLMFGIGLILSTIFSNLFLIGGCVLYRKWTPDLLDVIESRKHEPADVEKVFPHFVMYVLMYIATQLSVLFIYNTWGDSSLDRYNQIVAGEAGFMILLTTIVAPIAEEIFYRGVVYPAFKRSVGAWVGVFLQAFVFAAMHGTVVHLWLCFLGGFYTAMIYERFGRLSIAIALHSFFNSMTLFFNVAVFPIWFLNPFVVIVLNGIVLGVTFILYQLSIQHSSKKRGDFCGKKEINETKEANNYTGAVVENAGGPCEGEIATGEESHI